MDKGDGKPKAELQISDVNRLLCHISILLDYIQRLTDSRLQDRFAPPTHADNHAQTAMPPANVTYSEFLTSLLNIEERVRRPVAGQDLTPEDIAFLLWSRDFLAGVAKPATVETIAITQEYINTRAGWAGRNRWVRLGKFVWGTPIEIQPRYPAIGPRFRNSAQWLAQSVLRLEVWTVVLTILTVALSAHATVGRLIIPQASTAFKRFQQATEISDQAQLSLLKATRADAAQKFEQYPQFQYDSSPCLTDFAAPPAPVLFYPNPSVNTTEAELDRAVKCRATDWALLAFLTEDLRLRSWDSIWISYPPMSWLIGWYPGTLRHKGEGMSDRFCQQMADMFNASFNHPGSNHGCPALLESLFDSQRVANSVLACLTAYILPVLYAFIGAACATMLMLRRHTDACCLSYTDRALIKYNVLLGIAFGGVIGLFAGSLSSPNDADKLGLSVLAFLAGYNTPAVFRFLDNLSDKVFGPTPPAAAPPPAQSTSAFLPPRRA